MDTIIVTRHPALVDLVLELGLADRDTPVFSGSVTEDDVFAKHVIGVLPLHLAACAARVTVIPIDFSSVPRGTELDLETLRRVAGEPATYSVRREPDVNFTKIIAWLKAMDDIDRVPLRDHDGANEAFRREADLWAALSPEEQDEADRLELEKRRREAVPE